MADNTIQFRIGSTFSGEGFNKANKAIQDNRKELQSSVRGLGELSNAMSSISPATAEAMGAVKQFTAAFVSGGIVGGVISLAMQGIGEAVKFCAEKFKEAEERTAAYADILRNKLLAALGDSTAAFNEVHRQLTQSKREADDLLKVLNGNVAHEAASQVYQIKMDAMNKITEEMTEQERAVVIALRDKEIAVVMATAAEKQSSNALENATQAVARATELKTAAAQRVSDAEDSLAQLQERCGEYISKRTQIENYIATEEERFKDGSIGLREVLIARKDASLAIQKLEKEYSGQVRQLKDASASVTAAKQSLAEAEYAAKTAQQAADAAELKHSEAANALALAQAEGAQKVKDAQNKQTEVAKAQDQRDQAEADSWHEFLAAQKEKVDSAYALKAAEDEAAERLYAASDDINGMAKAADNLKKAQADVAAALAAYNKNINENLVNERIQAFGANGGYNQIGNRLNLQNKDDQAAAAAAAVADGIANGSIRTSAQANKAARDAARAQRDYASSKQARQEAQDARRLDQLRKEAERAEETGRKLDPRKQAELDRLEALQQGKNAQKAALEAAKEAEKQARLDMQKTAQNVEDIKRKLEKLGLK